MITQETRTARVPALIRLARAPVMVALDRSRRTGNW